MLQSLICITCRVGWKIGKRANVTLIFSTPEKLSKICKLVNNPAAIRIRCTVKHRTRFVPCVIGVVYLIPLSCGMIYIGQTGRYLNDRSREHNNNVPNVVQGHLGIHGWDSGCVPFFERCETLGKYHLWVTREINLAYQVNKFDGKCGSFPSVALLQKEIAYIDLF